MNHTQQPLIRWCVALTVMASASLLVACGGGDSKTVKPSNGIGASSGSSSSSTATDEDPPVPSSTAPGAGEETGQDSGGGQTMTAADVELCFDAHIGNDNAVLSDDPGEASDSELKAYDAAGKGGGVLELHIGDGEADNYGPVGGGAVFFFRRPQEAQRVGRDLVVHAGDTEFAPVSAVQQRGTTITTWYDTMSAQQTVLMDSCLSDAGPMVDVMKTMLADFKAGKIDNDGNPTDAG